MAELLYPAALGLTLGVEVPVYTWLLCAVGEVAPWRAAKLGMLVNLVSHPLLWFVFPLIARAFIGETVLGVVMAEVVVVALEAALLRKAVAHRFADLVSVSVVSNSLSFTAGLLVQLWL